MSHQHQISTLIFLKIIHDLAHKEQTAVCKRESNSALPNPFLYREQGSQPRLALSASLFAYADQLPLFSFFFFHHCLFSSVTTKLLLHDYFLLVLTL
jgi:hypothetical protein